MRQPYSPTHKSCAGLRIGLLGGSFNPAHAGHLAMSLYALRRLQLDQVWWLVSPQNPLKSTHDMARLNVRIEKARRLARHPNIHVMDLESKWGTCYTIDTLTQLKRRFPHTHFVWLMGADNLKQMPRWKQWVKIFATLPVAVFRRPTYAVGRGSGKVAVRFSRAFRPAKSAKNLVMGPVPVWMILDNPLHNGSSTALRNKE